MGSRGAASTPANGPVDVFQEFARRYSRAERAHANARHTERGSDGVDAALSMKQLIEQEFARCFLQVKIPDWSQVDAAARGEWDWPR